MFRQLEKTLKLKEVQNKTKQLYLNLEKNTSMFKKMRASRADETSEKRKTKNEPIAFSSYRSLETLIKKPNH